MVHLIIPAYNEGANLPQVVREIEDVLRGEPYRLSVVNDGSHDETASVLERLSAHAPITILTHPVNRGVAAAFRTGFLSVLSEAADDDEIILMEGDGTSSPSLLPTLLARIRAGADVVIASRYQPGGGYKRFPLKRLVLSRGANAMFRFLFPIPGVQDYTIFYRAYHVPPLRAAIQAHGERFIESTTFLVNAEILLKLRPYIRRVEEVPLAYDYGKKRGKTGMKIWKNLRSYLVFIARRGFRRT